ncbi:hypothetical protein FF1_023641 [Malus domestica]
MKESSLSPDLELVAVLFSIVTTARAFGIRAVAQNSGGEFYSSNIELGRAGKKKSPNVREDYLVHRFSRQKKLTFESNVHGSFGLQDTSHVLEGGKDINNTTFMIIDWEYAGNERCCYSLPS